MRLTDIIESRFPLRLVADDVYSVLPETGAAQYDRIAAGYDRIVGSSLYNRIVWGNRPADYTNYALRSLGTSSAGWHLDAGGGSLLFSARGYRDLQRPLVVFDRSLAMLARARTRLVGLFGRQAPNVFLLQGDLTDLPFVERSFESVLFLHVLHHIGDAASVLTGLARLRRDNTCPLSFTSLVHTQRRFANFYLSALHRSGEFVKVRTATEVREIATSAIGNDIDFHLRGSVAYVSTGTIATS